MSESSSSSSGGGVGFFGLLTVLLIGLKLTGYIAWSWWWVFAPLWAPAGLLVALLIGGLALTITAGLVSRHLDERRVRKLRSKR